MATHVITIPGWRPISKNEWTRWGRANDWRKMKKEKTYQAWLLLARSREQRVPLAVTPRRVSLRVEYPRGQRRHDPDAFWFVLLDTLVSANLLCNDSARWLTLGACDCVRGETLTTTITLEDIDA